MGENEYYGRVDQIKRHTGRFVVANLCMNVTLVAQL